MRPQGDSLRRLLRLGAHAMDASLLACAPRCKAPAIFSWPSKGPMANAKDRPFRPVEGLTTGPASVGFCVGEGAERGRRSQRRGEKERVGEHVMVIPRCGSGGKENSRGRSFRGAYGDWAKRGPGGLPQGDPAVHLLVETLLLLAAAARLKPGGLGSRGGHVQEVEHRGPLSGSWLR